jgi:DHA1 family bicyclomycin/chloramphenicol resistance-like MFS transporter
MQSNKPSTLLLGLASGMSPFAMVLVVPTIELFTQQYEAPYSKVQFILSAYLFGLALAQPIVGLISDKVGRRPVMIYGIILFLIASFICLRAETLTTLILARFIQGIGASVGSVVSRAMIRDTTLDSNSGKPLSRVVAIMGMAPMIAPVIGVLALEFFGDPSGIFIVTIVLGIMIMLPVIFLLPETLDRNLEKARSELHWHEKYSLLLRSKIFVGSTMVYGFTTGSFFALMAVASTVFSKDLGIDARGFGITWSCMTLLYAISTFYGGNLSTRIGLMAVMNRGVIINLVAGFSIFLLVKFLGTNLISFLIPLSLMFFAHGFIVSMSLTKAVSDRPEIAGSSSGLSSSIGLLTGGLFSIFSGSLYVGEFLPIASLVTISTILCGLSCWLITSGATGSSENA